MIPSDHNERKLALDPRQSFLCEAPAGSGKTELLTQRVLTLLAGVDSPESVLAITFTRKAAAEMRERILGALNSGLGPKPQEEHAKLTWELAKAVLANNSKRDWHLLDNPNRLQIRTFDSLCAALTRALPLKSSLGANINTTENLSELYQEAADALLDTLEKNLEWSESLIKLLAHLDNRRQVLRELLVRMLGNRDEWMPIIHRGVDGDLVRKTLQENLQRILADKIQSLNQFFCPEQRNALVEIAGFSSANLLADGKSSPILELLNIEVNGSWSLFEIEATENHDVSVYQRVINHWKAVTELLLTKQGGWRKKLDKNSGFPAGENKAEKDAFKVVKQRMLTLIGKLQETPGLLSALQGVNKWPSPTYRENQWVVLQALTEVLPILVAQLQLVFRKRNEVDFLEMGQRAVLSLGDEDAPTDLALHLDHKIQHILADEFQDTSFSQIALLEKLTMGWQMGDGRTLFCVGDAMQSIYAFRGANVGLFLNCKKFGLGEIPLTVLQLSTNFRSQSGIVDWVNKVFSSAFPPLDDVSSGAVSYSNSEAFRPQIPGEAVFTCVYGTEDGVDVEGRKVVQLVRQAQSNDPDVSIAILVRSKNHAASSVKALKLAGIKFQAVDLEPLGQQPIIIDLLALTKAMLFPSDRISWLSVLRAPWCGLTLQDLERVCLAGPGNKQDLVFDSISQCLNSPNHGLTDDGARRLHRCFDILKIGLEERDRKPLRQWIEGIWWSLGGAGCLQSETDVDDAERYFQCLEQLAARGEKPSIKIIDENIESLFSAPDPDADGRIQIMTMHKSKGLEFDVVILPGLQRRPRNQDPELLLWQQKLYMDGTQGWVLGPIGETGSDKDPNYGHLEYEKSARELIESCRLLYVACTRAKKQLFIIAKVERDQKNGGYKPPSGKSLLAFIWGAIKMSATPIELEAPTPERDSKPEDPEAVNLIRLPSSAHVESLPHRTLLQAHISEFEFDNSMLTSLLDQSEDELPRLLGTLVHGILQAIGQQGLITWKQKSLDELAHCWLNILVQEGIPVDVAKQAIPEVQATIVGLLEEERFLWILEGDCQFEYPLTVDLGRGLEECVIDVVLRDRDGCYWIVDYKTSIPKTEESIGDFMEREKQNYLSQMNKYRRALILMGKTPIRIALYFVSARLWAEY